MNESFDSSINQTTGESESINDMRSCAVVVAGIMVLLFLALLLVPPRRFARGAARRSQCLNHMRNIGIGMHNYASEHDGRIPLVNLVNDEGVALHSWRTTLLPYLDRAGLYRKIDKAQPWDSDENLEFTKVPLEVFQCPDSEEYENREQPMTNYFAVVGSKTAFPPVPANPEKRKQLTLDHFSDGDGAGITLGFVEASGQNVWWAEPRDISFSDLRFGISNENGRGVSSGHPAGAVNVIFLDGHGTSLSKNIDPVVLKAMCTINNYENEVKYTDRDF